MCDQNAKKSSFMALVFVVSLGVIVGLLIAPKTGKETRDNIREKFDDMAKKFKESHSIVHKK